MKQLFTMILFVLIFSSGLIAEPNVNKGTLTVKVTGLRSANGYVVCHIFNRADGYPTNLKKL